MSERVSHPDGTETDHIPNLYQVYIVRKGIPSGWDGGILPCVNIDCKSPKGYLIRMGRRQSNKPFASIKSFVRKGIPSGWDRDSTKPHASSFNRPKGYPIRMGRRLRKQCAYILLQSERVSHPDGIKMKIKVLGNGKC